MPFVRYSTRQPHPSVAIRHDRRSFADRGRMRGWQLLRATTLPAIRRDSHTFRSSLRMPGWLSATTVGYSTPATTPSADRGRARGLQPRRSTPFCHSTRQPPLRGSWPCAGLHLLPAATLCHSTRPPHFPLIMACAGRSCCARRRFCYSTHSRTFRSITRRDSHPFADCDRVRGLQLLRATTLLLLDAQPHIPFITRRDSHPFADHGRVRDCTCCASIADPRSHVSPICPRA